MVTVVTQDGEWTHLNNLEIVSNFQVDGNAVIAGSLTATTIVGQAPAAIGTALVLTAANAGGSFKLDTAAGSKATLPAATGTGSKFYFFVTTTVTSNSHKILAASSSDNITGIAIGENANTNKTFNALVSSGYHSIQMPAAGTTPSGGTQGDWFEFTDLALNLWHCKAAYAAGATPTTPFSTSTT